nr:pentapeptide repeat-containing protein [uncultured Bacteroides sp.]
MNKRVKGQTFSDSSFKGIKEDENIAVDDATLIFEECVFNCDLYSTYLFGSNSFSIKDLFTSSITGFSFRNCLFNGNVDLSLTNEELKYGQSNIIDQKIAFKGCTFEKEVSFNSYTFKKKFTLEKCKFKQECDLENNIFEQEIRLCGTEFQAQVKFCGSTFNTMTLFTPNKDRVKSKDSVSISDSGSDDDRVKFGGDVSFSGSTFSDARFWKLTFEGDVHLIDTKFNCPVYFNNSKFNGTLRLGKMGTIGKTMIKQPFYLNGATIKELQIHEYIFENLLSVDEARIEDVTIRNSLFSHFISLSGAEIKNTKDEYTARTLKNEAVKGGNNPVALKMKAMELNHYYKSIKCPLKLPKKLLSFFSNLKKLLSKRLFLSAVCAFLAALGKYIAEKVPLLLMKWSNGYGTKWIRALGFILCSTFFFFSIFVVLRDGIGDTFIWCNIKYLKEALTFVLLFDSSKEIESIQTVWQMLFFLLGKIFVAYGIYQLIAAFRKHSK